MVLSSKNFKKQIKMNDLYDLFVWNLKKRKKTEQDSCLNIKEKDFEIFEHKNS